MSIDFYNNDINNMEDNCIESDGGAYNIRVMRNRCFNHGHRALSVQPLFGGPVYFIRNIVYHAPEGGAVKLTATSSGIVFYHNTLIAPVKPMLGAISNVHFRNNLILGRSETPETFAVETYTNYSSSDYNGFRPNEGAEFSFEWMSPPFGMLSNYAAKQALSPQERIKAEAGSKEDRKFKTLQEFSEATGQDRHSVIVDYDVFQKVTPPDPDDPRILYKPADFDFQLRPGSVAVDAGVRLPNVNDGFTGKAPDLGAYEVGQPVPHYGPRESIHFASLRNLVQADIFPQLLARTKRETAAGYPGLSICTRIVDRDLVLHRQRIDPRVFLNHVQPLGVGMPGVVQPCSVVETNRVHHQSLSLPAADGVAQPIRIRIFWVTAPVHPYLAPDMRAAFIHEEDSAGRLHDLERSREKHDARNAGRQATQIHLALLHGVVLLKFQLGPRLERYIGLGRQVGHMARQPHAIPTQIGFTVGQMGNLSLRMQNNEGGKKTAIFHYFFVLPIIWIELFSSS